MKFSNCFLSSQLSDLTQTRPPSHPETTLRQEGLPSNHSPPFDSAFHGEISVRPGMSLPEALAKFSKCPIILQLREFPHPKTSSISPTSDCATLGGPPMSVARSLPEALAKFSNCSLSSQLREPQEFCLVWLLLLALLLLIRAIPAKSWLDYISKHYIKFVYGDWDQRQGRYSINRSPLCDFAKIILRSIGPSFVTSPWGHGGPGKHKKGSAKDKG